MAKVWHYCFECEGEFETDNIVDGCIHCETSDIIDITEEKEAEEHFDSIEEEISSEDLLEWQYGNDYHDKFVKYR